MTTTPWTRIMFVLVLSALLPGCDDLRLENTEIARVPSPDGWLDAVVAEGSVDATTAISYRLFIVASGQPIVNQEPLLVGDRFEGLDASWREDRLLDLNYASGRIFEFRNFWQSAEVDDWRYRVEVRLNSTADE